MIDKINFPKYFPFTHVCIHILCRFSGNGIILMSQRHCYARDPRNNASISFEALFLIARFWTALANFGFVKYYNHLIHVMIGFKHDVPCIGRLEALRATQIRQSTQRYAPCALTDSCGPSVASDLTMQGTLCLNPWWGRQSCEIMICVI